MAAQAGKTNSADTSALASRLKREITGDVLFDRFSRGRYATDASFYQIMMAIAGDIVKKDKFDEALQQAPAPVRTPPGYSRFYSFSERAPVTGTWGDPRTATAEKGARFLAVQAEALAEAIRDPVLWSRPDPVWRPGRGQETTAGKAE